MKKLIFVFILLALTTGCFLTDAISQPEVKTVVVTSTPEPKALTPMEFCLEQGYRYEVITLASGDVLPVCWFTPVGANPQHGCDPVKYQAGICPGPGDPDYKN